MLQGVRNKAELTAITKMLEQRHASIPPLTEAITQRAISLVETMTLSHGMQMGDALIAATAIEHQLSVLTGNFKHFSAIEGLRVEVFSH